MVREVSFKAVRSSGAGGQHVNKVSTKVILTFDPAVSGVLTAREKERLGRKLSRRLTREGKLQLSSGSARSQIANKKLVTQRFLRLVKDALKEEKKRRKTRPPRAANEARITKKKQLGQKKETRKKPPTDH